MTQRGKRMKYAEKKLGSGYIDCFFSFFYSQAQFIGLVEETLDEGLVSEVKSKVVDNKSNSYLLVPQQEYVDYDNALDESNKRLDDRYQREKAELNSTNHFW